MIYMVSSILQQAQVLLRTFMPRIESKRYARHLRWSRALLIRLLVMSSSVLWWGSLS